MAKKKNQSKKHRFKHATATVETSVVGGQDVVAAAQPAAAAMSSGRRPAAVAALSTRDFGYVGRDLRRISLLAVLLVGLELVLWYLLEMTAVGDKVFSLIRV